MLRRYGPETPVPDWRERLVCSHCGSRDTDMVVTGERRRSASVKDATIYLRVGHHGEERPIDQLPKVKLRWQVVDH